MAAHKKQPTQAKRLAKKAAVLGTSRKSQLPLVLTLAGIFLLAAGTAFYLGAFNDIQTATVTLQDSADLENALITHAVHLFDDGQARHFVHKADGVSIKYFVIKSSDGVVRAAFDACDVCWQAGKGYDQQGDQMVCRNCGQKFESVRINEIKGGCNPAPLQRKIENGKLLIRVSDILDGKKYFNFTEKA